MFAAVILLISMVVTFVLFELTISCLRRGLHVPHRDRHSPTDRTH